MELLRIQEPNLQFGNDLHISPTAGIERFSVYDYDHKLHPEKLVIGIVGSETTVRKTKTFLERCSEEIPAKPSKKPNLHTSFCGFSKKSGFNCEFVLDESLSKSIPTTELEEAYKLLNVKDRVTKLVELFLKRIDFIRQTKNPDVIICALPNELLKKTNRIKNKDDEDRIENEKEEEEKEKSWEVDFRRLLKAKAMLLPCHAPLQLVTEKNLESGKSNQDDATMAWNFCTALYYKGNGTPWRLPKTDLHSDTCYVGISFYRSRDKSTIQTSLAQVFNELGKGVILMGGIAETTKEDRTPHLNKDQSVELINKALSAYQIAHEHLPSRIVIHKTSKYNKAELEGFKEGIEKLGIYRTDFVTIRDSNIKIFRSGIYPLLRGTGIKISEKRYLLYTRGSIRYYETYVGKYVPQSLDIIIHEGDSDPLRICSEILSLTKMNWNNTRLDGKYPITIECSRRVGNILKYIPDGTEPQSRYSFYM